MGAGEGCYGIEHLVRNRDVEETVKGVVNVFGDFEPKSIGDTDEDKISWYMKVCSLGLVSDSLELPSIYWSSKPHSPTEKDSQEIRTMPTISYLTSSSSLT